MSCVVYLILRASFGICMPTGILKSSVRSFYYKKDSLEYKQLAIKLTADFYSQFSLHLFPIFSEGKMQLFNRFHKNNYYFKTLCEIALFLRRRGTCDCHMSPQRAGLNLVSLCNSMGISLTRHLLITINNLRKPGSWMKNKIKDGYRVPHELLAVSLM